MNRLGATSSANSTVAIVLASAGRRAILAETLKSLADQTVQADQLIVVCPTNDDAPGEIEGVDFIFVESAKGLTRQRNSGLDNLIDGCDLVMFFDDDVALADDYIEAAVDLFANRPEIVVSTGTNAADGVRIGGITRDDAVAAIRATKPTQKWAIVGHTYGCNMVARASIAKQVRFDERLPLYGWLEDRDFGARCGRFGEVGKTGACVFAHLGAGSGRVSGACFGFSQIMNAVYLWRKGSMTAAETIRHVTRALTGAIYWRIRDDRRLGRSDRLRGCMIAVGQVVRGRVEPERVLEIE